jgi:hypothetical protein
MGIEELGLGLATIRAFTIPPTTPISIETGATGPGHCDICSGYRYQRAFPFLIAKCGLAFENDLDIMLILPGYLLARVKA